MVTDRGLLGLPPALLVLADGEVFGGTLASGNPSAEPVFGEVVFNTALTGYQEVVSDPSYAGQIVVMTYPHIGNYGANPDDDESDRPAARGLVVRDLSRIASSHRAQETLPEYLTRNGVPALAGIDTRRLTRHIRVAGAMTGGIFTGDLAESDPADLVDLVHLQPPMEGRNLVAEVTCAERHASPYRPSEVRHTVHLVDYGVKRTILRRLAEHGCDVTVFPAATPAVELLAGDPDGVMLSNGPGDPAAVPGVQDEVRALLGRVPVFGICLGHQILSLALGATSVKLPFGHHGANHPVLDLATGEVEITSQNHGFNIEFGGGERKAAETPVFDTDLGGVEVTHRNLNDGTLEGIRCLDVPAFSVQYHPEAGPGPHDATYLFWRFVELMEST